jgi:hypothetical protein
MCASARRATGGLGRRLAVFARLAVALIATLCGCSPRALATSFVIPAGREPEVLGLVAPYRLGGEVADGFLLNGVKIGQQRIELMLEGKTEPAERVTLALTLLDRIGQYDLSVDPPGERQSRLATQAVAKLKEAVVRNADQAFWERITVVRNAASRDDMAAPDRQRSFAASSLWVAFAAVLAALVLTLVRAGRRSEPSLTGGAGAVSMDVVGVLAWSALVRFVLTEPNILTDGGSGYRRLQEFMPSYGGLSVLIQTLLPEGSHFMWTALRVPWVLATLAPPFLLLLGRALGFSRSAALLAGLGLASLPLHAAMYASDFELGALLSLQMLGLALVAAAIRCGRAELGAAGAAVLAYTCWGRPDAPVVGGVLLVIALPALARWRTHSVLLVSLAWFGVNALASIASTRASGGAGSLSVHLSVGLWPSLPVVRFLTLQEIVPLWLWVPLPFGVVRLVRQDYQRLAVVGAGVVAGFVPAYLRGGMPDSTQSFMEFFRYGTWALPWILLATAEGMEAIALFAARFGGSAPGRARRIERSVRAVNVALCVATPLVFHSYLSRRYGPSMEEEAFRAALRQVPDRCGLVVPDDETELEHQGGGTIEILTRYMHIADEAAARFESVVDGTRIAGVTSFLKSTTGQTRLPPVPLLGVEETERTPCWYYFRGSYCYTGVDGHPSTACADLERRATLEPVLSRDILYISHRLVTRPDLREPPLYDPTQRLVLSHVVGLGAAAPAAAPR